MKILILTQYYPPETGAPQNRLSSLAIHLKSFGNSVEVLTAMPNYPKYEIFPEYKQKKYIRENIEDITVHRSYIYVGKSKGTIHRLMNYFSFAISSYRNAAKKIEPAEVIICESPPLFLGITGVWLKKKWKCKLVFNVSDLWPESAEKLGIIKNKLLLKTAHRLAGWIYKNADLITGQTKGILEAIKKIMPGKKMYWLPNGVDVDKFEYTAATNGNGKSNGKFSLLYAGIIGHAQGLEVILHAADKLKSHNYISFYIIGDGPVKDSLVQLRNDLDLPNVSFISNQPGHAIIQWLHKCDAYIVPLRKIDLFKGAIPSKLFEPLAIGKPILLGVEGEARELFIDEAEGGLFFEPENAAELSDAVLKLYHNRRFAEELGTKGKEYVHKNFSRHNIALSFWEELQNL